MFELCAKQACTFHPLHNINFAPKRNGGRCRPVRIALGALRVRYTHVWSKVYVTYASAINNLQRTGHTQTLLQRIAHTHTYAISSVHL